MHLTKGQETVVRYLYENSKPAKTKELSIRLNEQSGLNEWSESRLRSILTRLEKRGIVWRSQYPVSFWRLTNAARGAYKLGRR